MGWVRLDDKFAHNPKLLKAGPLGLALHVAAICYCNQHLTDGFVPRGAVVGLLDFSGLAMRCWSGDIMGGGEDAEWRLVVDDVVSAGLWHEVQGGWSIHDYLEYQPSKAKIIEARAATAERQSRWRNGVTNTSTNGVSHTVSNAVSAGAPRKKEEEEKKERVSRPLRGSRLPSDWMPSKEDEDFARAQSLDPGLIGPAFRDYWISRPGAGGVKLDWHATWRTWCRRSLGDQSKTAKVNGHGPATGIMKGFADALAERDDDSAAGSYAAEPLLHLERR